MRRGAEVGAMRPRSHRELGEAGGPSPEAWGHTRPCDTLILDFRPSGPGENSFLCGFKRFVAVCRGSHRGVMQREGADSEE